MLLPHAELCRRAESLDLALLTADHFGSWFSKWHFLCVSPPPLLKHTSLTLPETKNKSLFIFLPQVVPQGCKVRHEQWGHRLLFPCEAGACPPTSGHSWSQHHGETSCSKDSTSQGFSSLSVWSFLPPAGPGEGPAVCADQHDDKNSRFLH